MGGHLRQAEGGALKDPFEKLLFPNGAPEDEPVAERVRYLRCASCTVNIGPGYLRQEVWLYNDKPICRSCGESLEAKGAYLAVTREELRSIGGGVALAALIRERKAR